MLLSDSINDNYGRKIVDTKDDCIVLKPIISRKGELCISGENLTMFVVNGIIEKFIMRGDQWDKYFKATGYKNIRDVEYHNGRITSTYSPVTSQADSHFETFLFDNIEFISRVPITYTFSACNNLRHMSFINCYSKNLGQAQGIFDSCTALEVVSVNECNFPALRSLKECFSMCTALKYIEVKDSNFTSVDDICGCFYGCQNFDMDLRDLYFGKLINMCATFKNCISLTQANLSKWYIEILYGEECFMNCENLTNVEFDILAKIPIGCMTRMFCNCENLKSINLSMTYLATDNVSLEECFKGCELLRELNIDRWDPSKKPIMTNFFEGCPNLKYIKCSYEMFEYMFFYNVFPRNTYWNYDVKQDLAIRDWGS